MMKIAFEASATSATSATSAGDNSNDDDNDDDNDKYDVVDDDVVDDYGGSNECMSGNSDNGRDLDAYYDRLLHSYRSMSISGKGQEECHDLRFENESKPPLHNLQGIGEHGDCEIKKEIVDDLPHDKSKGAQALEIKSKCMMYIDIINAGLSSISATSTAAATLDVKKKNYYVELKVKFLSLLAFTELHLGDYNHNVGSLSALIDFDFDSVCRCFLELIDLLSRMSSCSSNSSSSKSDTIIRDTADIFVSDILKSLVVSPINNVKGNSSISSNTVIRRTTDIFVTRLLNSIVVSSDCESKGGSSSKSDTIIRDTADIFVSDLLKSLVVNSDNNVKGKVCEVEKLPTYATTPGPISSPISIHRDEKLHSSSLPASCRAASGHHGIMNIEPFNKYQMSELEAEFAMKEFIKMGGSGGSKHDCYPSSIKLHTHQQKRHSLTKSFCKNKQDFIYKCEVCRRWGIGWAYCCNCSCSGNNLENSSCHYYAHISCAYEDVKSSHSRDLGKLYDYLHNKCGFDHQFSINLSEKLVINYGVLTDRQLKDEYLKSLRNGNDATLFARFEVADMELEILLKEFQVCPYYNKHIVKKLSVTDGGNEDNADTDAEVEESVLQIGVSNSDTTSINDSSINSNKNMNTNSDGGVSRSNKGGRVRGGGGEGKGVIPDSSSRSNSRGGSLHPSSNDLASIRAALARSRGRSIGSSYNNSRGNNLDSDTGSIPSSSVSTSSYFPLSRSELPTPGSSALPYTPFAPPKRTNKFLFPQRRGKIKSAHFVANSQTKAFYLSPRSLAAAEDGTADKVTPVAISLDDLRDLRTFSIANSESFDNYPANSSAAVDATASIVISALASKDGKLGPVPINATNILTSDVPTPIVIDETAIPVVTSMKPMLFHCKLLSPYHTPVEVAIKAISLNDAKSDKLIAYIKRKVHLEANISMNIENSMSSNIFEKSKLPLVHVFGVIDGCQKHNLRFEWNAIGVAMRVETGISLEQELEVFRAALHPSITSTTTIPSIASSIPPSIATPGRPPDEAVKTRPSPRTNQIAHQSATSKGNSNNTNNSSNSISGKMFLVLAIARALTAMHMQGAVHGNLKPSNIFLNKQAPGSRATHIRLSDMSACHLMTLGVDMMDAEWYANLQFDLYCKLKQNSRYAAPELFDNSKEVVKSIAFATRAFTRNRNKPNPETHRRLTVAEASVRFNLPTAKSDVFSMAILAWEILNDASEMKRPYSSVTRERSEEDVFIGRTSGTLPLPSLESLDKEVPDSVKKMIAACFDADYLSRPSILRCSHILEAAYNDLSGVTHYDIFLSNSWNNVTIPRLIKYYLNLIGYSVWFDEAHDEDDPAYFEKSDLILQNCVFFIACLDDDYIESTYLINTFQHAHFYRKRTITIFADMSFRDFAREVYEDESQSSSTSLDRLDEEGGGGEDYFDNQYEQENIDGSNNNYGNNNGESGDTPTSILGAIGASMPIDGTQLYEHMAFSCFCDYNLPPESIELLKRHIQLIVSHF